MCGICCVLGNENSPIIANKDYISEQSRLYNRGPDCQRRVELSAPDGQTLVMCGSVLGLRGPLTPQPLTLPGRGTLLWNGEIFGGLEVAEGRNDTEVLLRQLSECTTPAEILQVILRIEGPFSLIYWQDSTNTLWFGRDILGRRSLLWHFPLGPEDVFMLSSVRVHPMDCEEVPAVGIFSLKLSEKKVGETFSHMQMTLFPWKTTGLARVLPMDQEEKRCWKSRLRECSSALAESSLHYDIGDFEMHSSIPMVNKELPEYLTEVSMETLEPDDFLRSLLAKDHMLEKLSSQLIDVLQKAVQVRVGNIRKTGSESRKDQEMGADVFPDKSGQHLISKSIANGCKKETQIQNDPSVLSLQDGLMKAELNVNCFDDPSQEEVANSAETTRMCKRKKSSVAILFSGGLDSTVIAALADRCLPGDEPIDLLNVAFEQKLRAQSGKPSKHRKPGCVCNPPTDPFLVPDRQTGLTALHELNPGRQWNFVEINVTIEELRKYRQACVSELLYPLYTVLDDSIGCAVWFAARGEGLLRTAVTPCAYRSEAKVVLVGMGADEQLAGYSRHRTKFQESGWEGLIDELQMEVERISTRNLGRDDRIITDHGRESRLPFLDENVVSFLNQLPVHLKADLRLPRGVGEKLLLRLCAVKLGLPLTAVTPKRAIQFGSRIAKSENRKEHASDVCQRLQAPS